MQVGGGGNLLSQIVSSVIRSPSRFVSFFLHKMDEPRNPSSSSESLAGRVQEVPSSSTQLVGDLGDFSPQEWKQAMEMWLEGCSSQDEKNEVLGSWKLLVASMDAKASALLWEYIFGKSGGIGSHNIVRALLPELVHIPLENREACIRDVRLALYFFSQGGDEPSWEQARAVVQGLFSYANLALRRQAAMRMAFSTGMNSKVAPEQLKNFFEQEKAHSLSLVEQQRQCIEKKIPLTEVEAYQLHMLLMKAQKLGSRCVSIPYDKRLVFDLEKMQWYTNPDPDGNLSQEEFLRICQDVCVRREGWFAKVFREGKGVYLSTRKTGLARSLHITPSGHIWMHFTRKTKGDRLLGEGGFKRVMQAYNFDTGEVSASMGVHGAGTAEKEKRALDWFKGEDGFIQLQDFVSYAGKQGNKYRFLVTKADGDLEFFLQEGKLSAMQKDALARQLIARVAFMHKRGILHRDIKPANCLLKDGKLLIGDLGLCCLMRNKEEKAVRVGTERYLPPEYGSNKSHEEIAEATAPSLDAWACGVTLQAILGIPSSSSDPVPTEGAISWEAVVTAMLDPNPQTRLTPEKASQLLDRIPLPLIGE